MTIVFAGWKRLQLESRVLAGALALVAAWGVIALTALGGHGGVTPNAEVSESLAGVPRANITLGNPTAPMTLTVFADITNGRFRSFSNTALPALVRQYVRPGMLKIRLRTLVPPGAGADAQLAARLAAAASLQGRLWDFVEVFSSNYKGKGSLDAGAVASLLQSVPGLDSHVTLFDNGRPRVAAALARAQRLALDPTRSDPLFLLDGHPVQELPAKVAGPRSLLNAVAARWRTASFSGQT